jgi:hypothetical protein
MKQVKIINQKGEDSCIDGSGSGNGNGNGNLIFK